MAKKNWKVTTQLPELPDINQEESLLNMFDQQNADTNLFNLIDEENIRLSGSKMYLYKYYQSDDFDPVYMESRDKPISKVPVIVTGHYDPVSLSEELTQFGIEIKNDQLFTFNKSSIERALGRVVIPGDLLKPVFQDQVYEIFEVVEDSFESYGVYHLVCSAKLLRDTPTIQDTPITDTSEEVGGYAGGDDLNVY